MAGDHWELSVEAFHRPQIHSQRRAIADCLSPDVQKAGPEMRLVPDAEAMRAEIQGGRDGVGDRDHATEYVQEGGGTDDLKAGSGERPPQRGKKWR